VPESSGTTIADLRVEASFCQNRPSSDGFEYHKLWLIGFPLKMLISIQPMARYILAPIFNYFNERNSEILPNIKVDVGCARWRAVAG
jgi:hypothetical protein